MQAVLEDSSIQFVVMTGAGEKAYCAGGDIRGICCPLLVLDLGLLGLCDLGNNKCIFSGGGVDSSSALLQVEVYVAKQ